MMDMKFTLTPKGEVILEWKEKEENKKVKLTHGVMNVDISNINRTLGSTRVMLELSVSEIDVQYDSDRLRFEKRLSDKLRNER